MSAKNYQVDIVADEDTLTLTCSEHGQILRKFLIGNEAQLFLDVNNCLSAHLKKKHSKDSNGR